MPHQGRQNEPLRSELLFELSLSAYLIAVVVFLWEKPTLCLIALALGLVLQLFFWKERLDAGIMVIAALLGAPSEVVCIKSGLWSYHAPGLVWGVPVWLPLVWAFLINLFRRISLTAYAVISGFFPRTENNGWINRLFALLAFFIIVYFMTTVLLIAKTIAITFSVFMIIVGICRHSRQDLLLFAVGATLGTIGEVICMKLGFWTYHHPHLHVIEMPMSLPLAWGLSSVIIVSLADSWVKKRHRGQS